MKLLHGNIVYAESREELKQYTDSYIAIEEGKVKGIYSAVPEKYRDLPVEDYGDDVIIPAFSDLHVHAPQYPQRGLAMDCLLYDWLNSYTFPLEARYADMNFAQKVYDAFVQDMIDQGTMHAVIFGSIHSQATGYLLEKLEEKGILGYVGKVCMDMASPDYLCENTDESLRETEEFLCRYSNNKYAHPILTPRFAPTCSWELLTGLGQLAQKHHVGVQTHLVESLWEKGEANRLYPQCGSDTGIYEKAGMLGHGPFVGAHFIFPSPQDIEIMKQYNGYAVQCPDATVNVIAGIMRTHYLSDEGVNLGIGSDVAGGHSLGIYSQIARAVQLSKIKTFYEPDGNQAISFAEAFWMGTRQGGSLFGKVGSLEKGYDFDALVIADVADDFMELSPCQKVERFCCFGNKTNICARYLRGRKIG